MEGVIFEFWGNQTVSKYQHTRTYRGDFLEVGRYDGDGSTPVGVLSKNFVNLALRTNIHPCRRRRWVHIKKIDEAHGVDRLTFASIKCQPPRASECRIGKEVFQHTHGRDQVLIEALACYVCDSRFDCVCARV